MKRERNWSDIILLLLLPAPVTFIALLLGAVYVIASEDLTASTGDDKKVESAVEVSTLSPGAMAIATVNAAPVRESSAATVNTTDTTTSDTAGAEVAAASLNYDEALVTAGREDYLAICSACHGADAKGISGLGKTLVDSEFINTQTDEDLLHFIITGREIWDPLNTTGVAMPARGGSPILTDDEIRGIIAFIRTLNGTPGPTEAAATGDQAAVDAAVTDETVGPEAPTTPQDTAGQEVASAEPVEFTPLTNADISAFLDSLGVNLEYAEPLPERTGEVIYRDFCGIRYHEDWYTAPADVCDFLSSSDLSAEELTALVTEGNPIWSDPHEIGVHIPARLGYRPLTDSEIQSFVEYLVSQR